MEEAHLDKLRERHALTLASTPRRLDLRLCPATRARRVVLRGSFPGFRLVAANFIHSRPHGVDDAGLLLGRVHEPDHVEPLVVEEVPVHLLPVPLRQLLIVQVGVLRRQVRPQHVPDRRGDGLAPHEVLLVHHVPQRAAERGDVAIFILELIRRGDDGVRPVVDDGFDPELVVEVGVQVLAHGLLRLPVLGPPRVVPRFGAAHVVDDLLELFQRPLPCPAPGLLARYRRSGEMLRDARRRGRPELAGTPRPSRLCRRGLGGDGRRVHRPPRRSLTLARDRVPSRSLGRDHVGVVLGRERRRGSKRRRLERRPRGGSPPQTEGYARGHAAGCGGCGLDGFLQRVLVEPHAQALDAGRPDRGGGLAGWRVARLGVFVSRLGSRLGSPAAEPSARFLGRDGLLVLSTGLRGAFLLGERLHLLFQRRVLSLGGDEVLLQPLGHRVELRGARLGSLPRLPRV